jgi:hypothetical protein
MNADPRPSTTLTRAAWLRLAMTVFVGLAVPGVQAQPGDSQGYSDPPARVARVADVIGDAWLFDEDSKEWTRLQRNQTVAEGDRLRTDDHSRVALRAGSTALWLDERSDLVFDRFDEGVVQLQIERGDLAVQVRSRDAADDLRLLTRQGRLFAEREGMYRVEQLDRGTLARAWRGQLRFEPEGGGQPTWVDSGDQVEFWWADGPRVERQRLQGDAFGDWVMQQSRDAGLSASTQRYVSPEMTGAEELDRYGSWEQSPDYGPVWFPAQIDVGWAPYRYGHWAWTRYWGWAWVDDSPWGFAPFHYGRWVQWHGRWCWAPGTYVARPVYAPALVAFVGGGPSVSVGISIGFGGGRRPPPPNVGWVPLAPREAYVPAYRHTDIYARRLNNERDMRPVQNPRNAAVVGAISRPQDLRPQPQQPVRPAADMQWRGPGRGERDGADRNRSQPQQGQPQQQPWQRPQQVQQPQQPAPQVQQAPQQQRRDDWGDRNEREDRSRNRGYEQRQPQQQQMQAPEPQVQQPQDWGRRERGADRPQRQPEAPQAQPQVVQPPPAPVQQRPQAAPPAEQSRQKAEKTDDKAQRDRNRRGNEQER